jgi:hypothetical protein
MIFIAKPKPKSARIPYITVEDLSDALRGYIPAIYSFSYLGEDLSCDRAWETTTLHFSGHHVGKPAERIEIRAVIDGKSLKSHASRLYNMSFTIMLYARLIGSAPHTEKRRHLQIEPRADRSIAIRHIVSNENGRFVFADDEELRAQRKILLKLLSDRIRAVTPIIDEK